MSLRGAFAITRRRSNRVFKCEIASSRICQARVPRNDIEKSSLGTERFFNSYYINMKITYNWLKDFVDVRISPEALAEKLTMAGLEVVSLEKFQDDYVFEIEITSNRPDWLSIAGIAREVAAVTGKKFAGLRVKGKGLAVKREAPKEPSLSIVIQDKKDCLFYSARVIRDVKVSPSPAWLAKRLEAIGLRPVHNIVDITNYILYATGQPLHAFDLDKIDGGGVIVRKAHEGEQLLMIDGQNRKFSSEVLLICDDKKPLAAAGVMGGKDTEVTVATKNILLESAYFSPVRVRKCARLLALSTDSSYRFERSVDIAQVVSSSDMASSMILEFAGGSLGGLYKSGANKVPQTSVNVGLPNAGRLLNDNLTAPKIKDLLSPLGFEVCLAKKDNLRFSVPAFRQDVQCEADILEEISRIYGYENILVTLPAIKPQEIKEDAGICARKKIKEILRAVGFSEIITYSLIGKDFLKKAGLFEEQCVSLANPLSAQQEYLRPAMFPGLLEALRRNQELENNPELLFELGNNFDLKGEHTSLCLLAKGKNFLEAKGYLELLFIKLGIENYKFGPCSHSFFAEGQAADLSIAGKSYGFIGRVDTQALSRYKIEGGDVFVAELKIDELVREAVICRKYKPLPIYPSAQFDISLIVDESLPYKRILDEIASCGIRFLQEIDFKDLYRAKELGEGKKSITLSLLFRSNERTLTSEETMGFVGSIIKRLNEKLGAAIRK